MTCIEIPESGERKKLEHCVFVRRQTNGVVVCCPRVKAQGICDGREIWSLGSLEGYPEARIITLAEYEEYRPEADPDPELTAEEAMNIMMGGIYETQ